MHFGLLQGVQRVQMGRYQYSTLIISSKQSNSPMSHRQALTNRATRLTRTTHCLLRAQNKKSCNESAVYNKLDRHNEEVEDREGFAWLSDSFFEADCSALDWGQQNGGRECKRMLANGVGDSREMGMEEFDMEIPVYESPSCGYGELCESEGEGENSFVQFSLGHGDESDSCLQSQKIRTNHCNDLDEGFLQACPSELCSSTTNTILPVNWTNIPNLNPNPISHQPLDLSECLSEICTCDDKQCIRNRHLRSCSIASSQDSRDGEQEEEWEYSKLGNQLNKLRINDYYRQTMVRMEEGECVDQNLQSYHA